MTEKCRKTPCLAKILFFSRLDWLCADWCDDCVICRLRNNCPLGSYKDWPGLETHFKFGVLKEYFVR